MISERSLHSFSWWPCKKSGTCFLWISATFMGRLLMAISNYQTKIFPRPAACHGLHSPLEVLPQHWSRSQSWCSWKKLFHLCQLTTQTHRQQFCQLGRDRGSRQDQWIGLMASWENELGSVGRSTPCNASILALLTAPWDPRQCHDPPAQPGQSHEKKSSKAILAPSKSLQIFSLFPISSWSHGRNSFKYVYSNK